MDYETIADYLLNTFFLSDWERAWLELRYTITDEDTPVFEEILEKYNIGV